MRERIIYEIRRELQSSKRSKFVPGAQIQRVQFRRWNQSREDKMFFKSAGFRHFFETPAPFAVADEQEFDRGTSLDEVRRDGEQVVVPLELKEPRDFSDDKILGP